MADQTARGELTYGWIQGRRSGVRGSGVGVQC